MQSTRVLNVLSRQVRAYHGGTAHHVTPSMNELPVPVGSWQEGYNIRQKKYNAILFGGIAFTVISLVTAKVSGLVYFNYSPPESID